MNTDVISNNTQRYDDVRRTKSTRDHFNWNLNISREFHVWYASSRRPLTNKSKEFFSVRYSTNTIVRHSSGPFTSLSFSFFFYFNSFQVFLNLLYLCFDQFEMLKN